MAQIPSQPQDIFVSLMQDYLKVFGNEMISLMLYGSAAGGAYVKGKSDINVLVVLTEAGMDRLDAALELVKKWRKRRVAVPLVISQAFIDASLDAYPIEFLNMQNNSILIYGKNVLEDLRFKRADLRLQIERELKSKILLLREGYLESEGRSRALRSLIARSLPALTAIFNALLYLKTGSAPHDRRETAREMKNVFELDKDVWDACLAIKEESDALSSGEVVTVFKKYLRETEKICSRVDAL